MDAKEQENLRLLRRFRLIHFNRHDTRRRYTDWNSIMPLAEIVIDKTNDSDDDAMQNLYSDLVGAICSFDKASVKEIIVRYIKKSNNS